PTFFLAITLSLKQNVSKNLWAVKENFEFMKFNTPLFASAMSRISIFFRVFSKKDLQSSARLTILGVANR
ncbi:MAG: hypothetical protein ACYTFK_11450, partial [Planctomycetota bacterium]